MPSYPKPQVKQYHPPVKATWWLARPAYIKFMVRELTSLFIAGYAAFLVVLMAKADDVAAFQSIMDALKTPVSILLHLIVLGFALFHSITFFNLTPRVLVVQRGEDRLADAAIAGAHYAMWLVATLVILFVATR